jgi:hypothetical protein
MGKIVHWEIVEKGKGEKNSLQELPCVRLIGLLFSGAAVMLKALLGELYDELALISLP